MTAPFLSGLLVGLLLGAGVFGHALRLVTIWPIGARKGRAVVAVSACVVYALAALLCACESPVGYAIAVIGPVVGLSAVTLLPEADVDAFQVVLGVAQFVALGIALLLWWGP